MDTTKTITHLGLCAGYGGIELGLKRVIPNLRSVALCEIEAFAISNLVAKMESGLMDPAPIWPDLKTFPWSAFCDRVDILTGGYPCQPFSAAGQRKGKQDPRHLWPFIADGIRLLRPKLCFFENVEGHISLGLSDVIEDLAGMGYRTTWGIFSASECGAPHQRKRVFILAYKLGTGLEGLLHDTATQGWQEAGGSFARCSQPTAEAWPSRPGEQQYGWEPPRVVAGRQTLDDSEERGLRDDSDNQRQTVGEGDTTYDSGPCSGEAVADSHRIDRSAQAEGREHDRQAGPAGEELGDAGCQRQEERQLPTGWSEQSDQAVMADAISGWGQQTGSQCRPGEMATDSRCEEGSRDSQTIVSHDKGGNAANWQTQPPLGGDADGPAGGMDYAELCVTCDNRTDELRLLGNGVVPQTAELAFRVLIQELANE